MGDDRLPGKALAGDERMSDHLTPRLGRNGRLVSLPPIPGGPGEEIEVQESSASSGPHIWLISSEPVVSDPPGSRMRCRIHLTAENALRLSDQLRWLVDNHYQTS